MDVPEIQYTRSGDVAIAYQTVGDGPSDLVLVPFLANIWSLWRLYRFAEFGQALARGRRLIVINPRGVGLSERPRGFTIESRMDDIRTVMDTVGCERAALLGLAESAATCAVFAATYPERTDRLILYTPYVRAVVGEDDRERALDEIRVERERWGERAHLEEFGRALNPQWADNEEYLESFVTHHRLTASPTTFVEFRRMQIDLDIADVLPAIRVPTLVISKERMREAGAEVATAIVGADHVEIPGEILHLGERLRAGGDRGLPGGHLAATCARHGPRDAPLHRPRRLDRAGGGARRPRVARRAVRAGNAGPPRARPLSRAGDRHCT